MQPAAQHPQAQAPRLKRTAVHLAHDADADSGLPAQRPLRTSSAHAYSADGAAAGRSSRIGAAAVAAPAGASAATQAPGQTHASQHAALAAHGRVLNAAAVAGSMAAATHSASAGPSSQDLAAGKRVKVAPAKVTPAPGICSRFMEAVGAGLLPLIWKELGDGSSKHSLRAACRAIRDAVDKQCITSITGTYPRLDMRREGDEEFRLGAANRNAAVQRAGRRSHSLHSISWQESIEEPFTAGRYSRFVAADSIIEQLQPAAQGPHHCHSLKRLHLQEANRGGEGSGGDAVLDECTRVLRALVAGLTAVGRMPWVQGACNAPGLNLTVLTVDSFRKRLASRANMGAVSLQLMPGLTSWHVGQDLLVSEQELQEKERCTKQPAGVEQKVAGVPLSSVITLERVLKAGTQLRELCVSCDDANESDLMSLLLAAPPQLERLAVEGSVGGLEMSSASSDEEAARAEQVAPAAGKLGRLLSHAYDGSGRLLSLGLTELELTIAAQGWAGWSAMEVLLGGIAAAKSPRLRKLRLQLASSAAVTAPTMRALMSSLGMALRALPGLQELSVPYFGIEVLLADDAPPGAGAAAGAAAAGAGAAPNPVAAQAGDSSPWHAPLAGSLTSCTQLRSLALTEFYFERGVVGWGVGAVISFLSPGTSAHGAAAPGAAGAASAAAPSGAAGAAQPQHLAQLQSLKLVLHDADDAAVLQLCETPSAPLRALPVLQELDVCFRLCDQVAGAGNPAGDPVHEGLHAVSRLLAAELRPLRVLKLAGMPQASHSSLAALAGQLASMHHLRELHLVGAPQLGDSVGAAIVRDVLVRALPASGGPSSLTHLTLRDCGLGNDTIRSLQQVLVEAFKRLHAAIPPSMAVAATVVDHITPSLPLHTLCLAINPSITEATCLVKAIAENAAFLHSLAVVDLARCGIAARQQKALAAEWLASPHLAWSGAQLCVSKGKGWRVPEGPIPWYRAAINF